MTTLISIAFTEDEVFLYIKKVCCSSVSKRAWEKLSTKALSPSFPWLILQYITSFYYHRVPLHRAFCLNLSFALLRLQPTFQIAERAHTVSFLTLNMYFSALIVYSPLLSLSLSMIFFKYFFLYLPTPLISAFVQHIVGN